MGQEVAEQPSVLAVASAYIEGGMQVVLIHGPGAKVEAAGKRPKQNEWQKILHTKDSFKAAYKEGDNLGVMTGKASGIIVVDIEPDGIGWYYDNEHRLGNFVREHSPSGGVHLYFRYPEGLAENEHVPSRIKLWPSVDILADGGRQVVTWPSEHPRGGQYAIANGLTLLDVEHEADVLPLWIFEELLAKSHSVERGASPRGAESGDLDHAADLEQAGEFLASVSPAINGEGGDNRTFWVACRVRDFGLSEEMAYKYMLEHFNPRCIPPWEPGRLRRKVANAYRYAKGPAGGDSVNAMFEDIEDEDLEIEVAVEEVKPETKAAPAPEAETEEEQAEAEEKKGYPLKNPTVCMARFLKDQAGRIKYADKDYFTYSEKQKRWRIVDDELVQSIVQRRIKQSSKKTFMNLKPKHVSEIERLIRGELLAEGFSPQPDKWLDPKRRGDYVALLNGILDIATGDLHPHSSSWFSFTVLPYQFDASAQCPTFHEFLASIWGVDEDIKRCLQLWMGYILLGDTRHQKFALFIGESRGGKGTLMNVIEALVGEDNRGSFSLEMFGERFGLAALMDKRLAIFPDAERASETAMHIATERIKAITGNDPIGIDRKYSDAVTRRLPVKIVITCNEIPNFVNSREALTNRMLVFPFKKSFRDKEDVDLGAKLNAEMPGILNWAIEGARAIINGEKFVQSVAGTEEMADIKASLDSIKGFCRSNVEYKDGGTAFVATKHLYAAYKQWCGECEYRPKSLNRFVREFTSAAPEFVQRSLSHRDIDGLRHRGYVGVVLRDRESVDDTDPGMNEIPF
jgi:putative DNA primase/helicase